MEGGGGKGVGTSERPVTDHVISGPRKKLHPMVQTHRHTYNRQTDMATL